MTIDPFILENVRLRPGFEKTMTMPISVPVSRKNQKRQKHFILVPWIWYEQLLKARHTATLKIALQILYKHWKNDGKTFELSTCIFGNVSRRQKRQALAELEAFGLITVERRKCRSPLVTAHHRHCPKKLGHI
jgi:hypothetical protein